MNRDPTGYDCTRDPIYLAQSRNLQLTSIPYWCEFVDCEYVKITDPASAPDDVRQAMDVEDLGIGVESFLRSLFSSSATNDDGIPFVLESWKTEAVYLTRAEAESWMKARDYRWEYGWRVYCVCAEGELARVLNDLPEPVAGAEIERLREGGTAC